MENNLKVSDCDEAVISATYDFFSREVNINIISDILSDRGIGLREILHSKEISDPQRIEFIKALKYDKRVIE